MPAKAHEVYHSQMTEAKLRILAAERVSVSSTSVTDMSSLDCEFCFLQIRKVIELITFGALVREQERYRQYRKTEPKRPTAPAPDPTKDWNAKEILAKLVRLSPHMLPIPLSTQWQTIAGVTNFDRAKIIVNHSKLIELYTECSGFMHSPNPLVEDFHALIENQRRKYVKAPEVVKNALAFLRQLLWFHAAVQLEWTDPNNPSSVDNPTSAWIVDFSNAADGVVHMSLATTLEEDPL